MQYGGGGHHFVKVFRWILVFFKRRLPFNRVPIYADQDPITSPLHSKFGPYCESKPLLSHLESFTDIWTKLDH